MQAKVVLPLALQEELNYHVPPALEPKIQLGMRALVVLGKRKYYVGIITELIENEPPSEKRYKLKEILALPDERPTISEEELAFWHFLAYYYIVPLGSILPAALPRALLPSGKMPVRINVSLLKGLTQLSSSEELSREALLNYKRNTISFEEFVDRVGKKALPFFDRLLADDIFTLDDSSLSPPQVGVEFVTLGKAYHSDEILSSLVEELKKTPAQQALFIRFLTILDTSEELDYTHAIELHILLEGDQNRRNAWKKLIARYPDLFGISIKPRPLATCDKIVATPMGSEGELYLKSDIPTLFVAEDYPLQFAFISRHIKAVLDRGKRVLLLLPQSNGPEGDEAFIRPLLGISNIPILFFTGNSSQKERMELRKRLRESDETMLIVGSRAAAFLPSEGLGLIIVAEEQDIYYKQQEASPRFHARDVLVFRAKQLEIPIILSTVTPSLESLYNAKRGKYRLIREGEKTSTPARLILVDSKRERKIRRLRYDNIVTKELRLHIEETLAKGYKVLVLVSRKGFAPSLHCFACGESIKCSRCDVTLTYHRYQERLICSYCGFCTHVPKECPTCQSRENVEEGSLKKMGFGSERVESELVEAFPQAKIVRIDAETTRGKGRQKLLKEAMLDGDTDIYVGTSLVTRLNSLGEIQLIAIPQLDLLLSFPDFRNDEQIFASFTGLMRRYPQAPLLLQTGDLNHPIIDRLQQGSYQDVAEVLLQEREFFDFPPFERLIRIIVKGDKIYNVEEASSDLANALRGAKQYFPEVDGPIEPFVSRIKLQYIRHITLRVASEESSSTIRLILHNTMEELRRSSPPFRHVRILFDVDPY